TVGRHTAGDPGGDRRSAATQLTARSLRRCRPPARDGSAVGEHRPRGVVTRDEGDAGAAVAAGASEVETRDAVRLVTPPAGSRTEDPHLLGVDQPVAVVA